MSERLLFLDTSTSFSYLACFLRRGSLWNKQTEILISLPTREILGQAQNHLSLEGDRWLSDSIQFLLKQNNCKKFEYIALGKGPGFFTSLRVGHIALATLALLWGSELLHFSSLSFWHEFFKLKNEIVFTLRANRNLFYTYSKKLELASKSFLSMQTQQLIEFAKENPNQKICLWQDPWNNHTTKKNIQSVQKQFLDDYKNKIQGSKNIIKTPDLKEAFQNQEQQIPQCIQGDIQKKTIAIQEFLPVYGHQIYTLSQS